MIGCGQLIARPLLLAGDRSRVGLPLRSWPHRLPNHDHQSELAVRCRQLLQYSLRVSRACAAVQPEAPEAQPSMHMLCCTGCPARILTSSSNSSMHVSQRFCPSVQVGDAVTFVWSGNHDVWRVPEAACPPVRCCAALQPFTATVVAACSQNDLAMCNSGPALGSHSTRQEAHGFTLSARRCTASPPAVEHVVLRPCPSLPPGV